MTLSRAVRTEVVRAWSGEGSRITQSLLVGLTPFEWAFAGTVALRNRWYGRRQPASMRIPVVSVGNLTVGGTGKTPFIKALGVWLRERGANPGVVTRGYGADEVALYERWFGPDRVFVAPVRAKGVIRGADSGTGVALVDDAFQHRRLKRDLDLLLIAAEGPYPVRLLPRGPYREPLESARRASLIVLTRRMASTSQEVWRERLARAAPGVPVVEVALGATGWADLEGRPVSEPEGGVVAAAATASPRGVQVVLEELLPGTAVELVSFPDHHLYTSRDIERLLDRCVDRTLVTTEKDAVKLVRFPGLRGRCKVLQFGVVGSLPEGLTGPLSAMIPGGGSW